MTHDDPQDNAPKPADDDMARHDIEVERQIERLIEEHGSAWAYLIGDRFASITTEYHKF